MTKHCRNCRNNIPNTGGCRCRCHLPKDKRKKVRTPVGAHGPVLVA